MAEGGDTSAVPAPTDGTGGPEPQPRPEAKPRGLLMEVGIIGVGVLLALAAQQAVEWVQWRSDVRDARQALGQEIGLNLATLDQRLALSSCIGRRLDDLERALNRSTDAGSIRLTRPIGRPIAGNMIDTTWEVLKSGAIVARLPLRERLDYAQLYGSLSNLRNVQIRERDAWADIQDFQGANELSAVERRRLQGLIARARWLNSSTNANAIYISNLAAPLKPDAQFPQPVDPSRLEGLCTGWSDST